MFKKVVLSLALLVPFKGMSAAAGTYESFTAKDGSTLRVRPVVLADFENPIVIKGFSAPVLENRKKRCEDGEAGIFPVESSDGAVVGRLVAGGMPLGYQPWPSTSDDDKGRSTAILSFYAALVSSIHQEQNPTKKHREGGMDLLHINPDVRALTVVLNGDFATISAQEAIVKLVRTQGMKIARDPGVMEAGIPSLCVSITKAKDLASTALTQVYPDLPYDAGSDGLYSAVVTSMVDGVVLPAPGAYTQKDFSSW